MEKSLAPSRAQNHPGVLLASASFEEALRQQAAADRYLWVGLRPPDASARGKLGALIEEEVERALTEHGAVPRSKRAGDLEDALSDQIYRARLIEQRGIAVFIPSLAGIADRAGALAPEDWQTLGDWVEQSDQRPMSLAIDDSNLTLGAYTNPVSLQSLLKAAEPMVGEPAVVAAGSAEPEPLVAAANSEAQGASDAEDEGHEPAKATAHDSPPAPTETTAQPEASTAEWLGFYEELCRTRGPRPLAAVERTFVTAYVPLSEAVARGLTDQRAVDALTTFRDSFARSYSEAFEALRVRGKRPTMVLDVPDVAHRLAKTFGARSVQLVLVDGMRFDVAMRVEASLKRRTSDIAKLVERQLLWSALPTTTSIQIELLGKGPCGLSEPLGQVELQEPVARGAAGRSLRRMKAGHRELFKLDIVESSLAAPGGPLLERLDEVAEDAGEVLADHFRTLPPRTLVVTFGDHGFLIDPLADGTMAARSGGASPEEVLVVAGAWLVA